MLCSPVLTSVFPSLVRKRLRDQKMQKMERVREPATRFGEDPGPWRSFILLRRLLQHRINKQLPLGGIWYWHLCRSSFFCVLFTDVQPIGWDFGPMPYSGALEEVRKGLHVHLEMELSLSLRRNTFDNNDHLAFLQEVVSSSLLVMILTLRVTDH